MVDPDDYDPEYILHLREYLADCAARIKRSIPEFTLAECIAEAVDSDLVGEVAYRYRDEIEAEAMRRLDAGAGQ